MIKRSLVRWFVWHNGDVTAAARATGLPSDAKA